MESTAKNTVTTILTFIQYALQTLMANPLLFMGTLLLLMIGKKGSLKVGGSGITIGK